MPTLSVKKRLLDKHLELCYSYEKLNELLFSYGLEIDDVVMEKDKKTEIEEEVYKIDIPANRYDLLCVEGLCKALIIFKERTTDLIKTKKVRYHKRNEPAVLKIFIKPETEEIRPYAIGAVLRGVKFDSDSYASFIDLQDKLHQNICRKRTLAAIGTHDLSKITGNVTYCAKPPKDIKFCPLTYKDEYTAAEMMELFASGHLREYLPIIKDKKLYPVFCDEDGTVLSMPPIINSEATKITEDTHDIFIEVTGTNLKKLEIVLDTMVTAFSVYCSTQFMVDPIEVVYPDDKSELYPKLEHRQMMVDLKRMNTKIGIKLSMDTAVHYLKRMNFSCITLKNSLIMVKVPPTRHDVLHECDIAGSLAIAYDINELHRYMPESNTVGKPLPLNKLTDALRMHMTMCSWTEVLTFSLCSLEDVTTRMRKSKDILENVVKILNPKTSDFQVVRNSLLPGILKTLANNQHKPLPLMLFELQDVVLKDKNSDTGCRNERRLCAVYCGKKGAFEDLHSLLFYVMGMLEIKPESDNDKNLFYSLDETDDPSFFDGQRAKVSITKGGVTREIGVCGIMHPEVSTNFGMHWVLSALEINVEPIFEPKTFST